ncbi:hypothetical protein OSB04_012415 [Centaurea solstitialis]|uniref:Reverse transcriptase domain-containing protein n=1 Tax=Centaurea solstitialis TaxID=347529 RepID=A0AA38TLZ8_9ASTR|nr:hypothetical protein OSB04_012415 [Centaurea solstitialis]
MATQDEQSSRGPGCQETMGVAGASARQRTSTNFSKDPSRAGNTPEHGEDRYTSDELMVAMGKIAADCTEALNLAKSQASMIADLQKVVKVQQRLMQAGDTLLQEHDNRLAIQASRIMSQNMQLSILRRMLYSFIAQKKRNPFPATHFTFSKGESSQAKGESSQPNQQQQDAQQQCAQQEEVQVEKVNEQQSAKEDAESEKRLEKEKEAVEVLLVGLPNRGFMADARKVVSSAAVQSSQPQQQNTTTADPKGKGILVEEPKKKAAPRISEEVNAQLSAAKIQEILDQDEKEDAEMNEKLSSMKRKKSIAKKTPVAKKRKIVEDADDTIIHWTTVKAGQKDDLKVIRRNGKENVYFNLDKFISVCTRKDLDDFNKVGLELYGADFFGKSLQRLNTTVKMIMESLDRTYSPSFMNQRTLGIILWRVYPKSEVVMLRLSDGSDEFHLFEREYNLDLLRIEGILKKSNKHLKLNELEKQYVARVKEMKRRITGEAVQEEEAYNPFGKVENWKVISQSNRLYYKLNRHRGYKDFWKTFSDLLEHCSRENLKEIFEHGMAVYGEVLNEEEVEDAMVDKIKKALEWLCMLFDVNRVQELVVQEVEIVNQWVLYESCGVYAVVCDGSNCEYYLVEGDYNHSLVKLQKMIEKGLSCSISYEMGADLILTIDESNIFGIRLERKPIEGGIARIRYINWSGMGNLSGGRRRPELRKLLSEIISLNIRGIGAPIKKVWLKDICKSQSPETKLKEVQQTLVFDIWGTVDGDFVQVEASGNSGGLLTIWNKNVFNCDFVIKEDNFMAVISKWDKIEGMVGCVNVYGPSDLKGRQDLWKKLDALCDKEEIKWIFFGDFNEVRGKHERLNSVTNSKGASNFNDFIHRNGLSDIKLGGNRFTRASDDGTKFSKLDRFLVTAAFEKIWRNIGAKVLERKWSDHASIMLFDQWRDFGPSPFKFFDVWLSDKRIEEVVKDVWQVEVKSSRPDCMFRDKLKNVKFAIKEWRKEREGDIESSLKKAKEEVKKWELKGEVTSLREEERFQWVEARRKWLDLEEKNVAMARQKAKVKWIKEGDENSKFFHIVSKYRKRKNSLTGLNIGGTWSEDPKKIKDHIFNFFRKKFANPPTPRHRLNMRGLKRLLVEETALLEERFSEEEEVWSAIKECGTNKSPGPDGFTIEFVKKFWGLIKADLMKVFDWFWEKENIAGGCNASFFTLIPKSGNPLGLNDFRQISLIGILYKLISKVLAERMKKVIGGMISIEQSAFLKGRSILDGILIANEMVDFLKKSKRKAKILKIDFEKAYDTVEWTFLLEALENMGFGEKWRK